MPRCYDHSHDLGLSKRDYIWSVYREPRKGRGEMTWLEFYGARGLFAMAGLGYQFHLSMPDGRSPYDNAVVDPVFQWLGENAVGRWRWHEGETNNNRSVSTWVYLEAEADIEAFRATWGGIFDYDPKRTSRNAAYLAAEEKAAADNVLPEWATVATMATALYCMEPEIADWLDSVAERSDFAATFAKALPLAVAELVEPPPSRWGPRKPDGTWEPAVLSALGETGSWIRTRAPESVRLVVADFVVEDARLAGALGSLAGEVPSERLAPAP